MKLAWQSWLYGLGSGFIGGGASAMSSFFANNLTDPKDFNIGAGLHHTLVNAGITFLIAGSIVTFAFLKQSPLPKEREVWTDEQRAAIKQEPPKP
jgi:hypothetical protein